MVCTDIDECADGTDTCDPNATCTNTAGSFSCACNPGYMGDGLVCTAVGAFVSCADVLRALPGATHGVYSIAPDGSQFVQITNNIAWELRPVFLRARGPIPP